MDDEALWEDALHDLPEPWEGGRSRPKKRLTFDEVEYMVALEMDAAHMGDDVDLLKYWFPRPVLEALYSWAVREAHEEPRGRSWEPYIREAIEYFKERPGIGWPVWTRRGKLFKSYNLPTPRMPRAPRRRTHEGA
jgi:hypothetical protein